MESTIIIKSIMVLLLLRLLPSVLSEPRATEALRDRSVYSAFFKRSLSSDFKQDEAKMILTNSIGDDHEESGSQVENPSESKTTPVSQLHSNSSGSNSTDPPIFNVIPDSNSKETKPSLKSSSAPVLPKQEVTSIVSDLMKEPQILMDLVQLKLARVKQVGVAVLMFAIAVILKALLTAWVPYLLSLSVVKAISNVAAQEAGRKVLGNGILYAISAMSDKFG